ncbi:MAG: LamG domain-containing protein [Planctomycetota bacterium]|jgi:hypothetical protein
MNTIITKFINVVEELSHFGGYTIQSILKKWNALFYCGIAFMVLTSSGWCDEKKPPLEQEAILYISFDDKIEPTASVDKVKANTDNLKFSFVDGKKGKALVFGEYHLSYAGVKYKETGAVSYWIKPLDRKIYPAASDKYKNHRHFISLTDGGSRYMPFYQQGKERLRYDLSNQKDLKLPIWANTSIWKDEWYHIASTWDGAETTLYINGEKQGSKEYKSAYGNFSKNTKLWVGPLQVGRTRVVRPFYNDTAVDELMIFDRCLSGGEIAELAMKNAKTVTPPSPVLRVPRSIVTPTIDGEIKKGEWDDTTCIFALIDGRDKSKTTSYPSTVAKFKFDTQNLYLCFTSFFPRGVKPPPYDIRTKDVEPTVYNNESFEFWLLKDSGIVYRFAGNTSGGFNEMKGVKKGLNKKWDCAWEYKSSIKKK